MYIFFYILQQVKNNPYNYDSWFDYLRLMESEGSIEATREVYERAIANVPLKKVILLTLQN